MVAYNPLCICSGMDLTDPKEVESMRHQLEDAQRWNASLQARLGAIQNRGGGVGGANDGGTNKDKYTGFYITACPETVFEI